MEQGELDQLETEQPLSASKGLDRWSTEAIVALMHQEDLHAVQAVGKVIGTIAAAAEQVAAVIRAGGHIFYVGAGTSGRIGALDASEWHPTFGTPPDLVRPVIAGGEAALLTAMEAAEDDEGQGAADVMQAGLQSGDLVIGLSASGRSPYVVGALRAARHCHAQTVGIACNTHPALAAYSDLVIAVQTGPEVLCGSTRLKAGTAQKLVLNMISTAAMVRLGKVYDNLMVDLVPSNQKLQRRVVRTLMQAAHLSSPEAEQLLKKAGGELKVALILAKTDASVSQARAALSESDGQVRQAIEALQR